MPFANFLKLPPSCLAIVLLLTLSHFTAGRPDILSARARTIPAPLSFSPAQNWEGIDGQWNTFVLRVGTPEQTVRVVISTASQQTWVVDPRACPDDSPSNNSCGDSRGTTFSSETSSSWRPQGLYDLWIESNLGLVGNAEYGFETVGLGYPGESGVTLKNQVVGAMATPVFNFGHFGINPKPTNFTNFTSQSPSFLSTLKDQNTIPSVSWGYTAGAPYRFAKVLSSLTLGGFDSSRFIPNTVSFPFAPDNERDVLVSIQSITSTDISNNPVSLLMKPAYAYVDSTVAEIWLPTESCLLFEKAFGLKWDRDSELYLVSDVLHNQLTLTNPNVTFNVSPWTQQSGQSTATDSVNIVLPYKAFDLIAKPPYQGINKTSRYFPLRRARNESEYTLGRTFFQEAYIIVDWERQNFSVSQCSWVAGASQRLMTITSANVNSGSNGTSGGAKGNPNRMQSASPGAIAGISVGVLAILVLTGVLAYLCLRRKRDKAAAAAARQAAEEHPRKIIDSDSAKMDEEQTATLVFPKAELEASSPYRHEADDGTFYKRAYGRTMSTVDLVESDCKQREIYEMPGDMPKMQEADGVQLSEKQAMRRREERFNGVDPATTSPVSINASTNSHLDRSPISPNDRSPTGTTADSITFPSTIGSATRRAVVASEIVELQSLDNRTMLPVSPLDGSDGTHTFQTFSPLSPIAPGTDNSPDSTRKRFSYED